MSCYMKEAIPEELILAQELQKAREFQLSRNCFQAFFNANPSHCLRFKALYEVADNYFHEGLYPDAQKAYIKFLDYCKEQSKITEAEKGWISAYTALAFSRMEKIEDRL